MPQLPGSPNTQISTEDILKAGMQPRKSLESSLLKDIWYALSNNKASMAKEEFGHLLDVPEHLASSLLTMAQAGLNFSKAHQSFIPLPDSVKQGWHVPGSTLPAPKNIDEINSQAFDVATFGIPKTFGEKKAKALKAYDPTRKNADGTLATLEDDAVVNLQAAGGLAGEFTGVTPLIKGLSNTYEKPVTPAQRLNDVLFGGLTTVLTVIGGKQLLGGRAPGATLMDAQFAEREAAAKKVFTADDAARDLGLSSGEGFVDAAKNGLPLSALLKAQKEGVIREYAELDKNKGITLAKLKNRTSTRQPNGMIMDDAGAIMKDHEGNTVFINAVDPESALSKRMMSGQTEQGIFSADAIGPLSQEARRSEIFDEIVRVNPTMADNHLLAAAIESGALEPATIDKFAQQAGVAPLVAQQELAAHFAHTATIAGRTLEAFGLGNEGLKAFRELKDWFGTQKATTILKTLFDAESLGVFADVKRIGGILQDAAASLTSQQRKAVAKMQNSPLANTARGMLMNISKLSTSSMLSFISNPIRNFENALGMNGIASFEDALVDTASRMAGSLGGAIGAGADSVARRSVLANITSDFAQMLMGRGELAAQMSKVIDAIPSTSKYLRGSASQIMGHLAELHATGNNILDHGMNAYAGVLQAMGTIGEMPMRQGIYGARVVKNIEAIKHWGKIVAADAEVNTAAGRLKFAEEWATNPKAMASKYGLTEEMAGEVDQQMRQVFGDAKIHTLKQQLGFATDQVQEFVNFYHSIPFADVLGPTFPKMVYNTWRWTMEHNPANLFSILDAGVRERILAGAEGGFQTRAAQRDYAKAMSGAALFNVAYGIRSGAFGAVGIEPGARPHEIKTGGITNDVRAFSPWDKYLVMADMTHKVMGLGMSVTKALSEMTSPELSDFTIGQRRIGDAPILGLEKFFQDLVSGDGDRSTERLKKLAGDFIGRFATPLRNAKLITDLISPSGKGPVDYNNNPMTGPTLGKLPEPLAAALGDKFGLQPQVDPTTGKDKTVENPRVATILQLGAFKIDKVPALAEELKRINFPTFLLTGNNGDERLDRAVAKHMGDILQEPITYIDPATKKSITMEMGNYIAGPMMDFIAKAEVKDTGQDLVLTDSARIEKMKTIFGNFRVKALAAAYGEYPQLLVESKINAIKDLTKEQREALKRDPTIEPFLHSPAPQAPKK